MQMIWKALLTIVTFSLVSFNASLLDNVDVGSDSTPAFIDIDADGDFDLFIGEKSGIINYYRNTGSASNPSFVEQTGPDNPFDGVDVGANSAPGFVDIDNDGDFDAFVGELDEYINYYKNIGSATNPSFVEQTGANNPLDGFMGSFWIAPSFVDIDNDGDFDLFLGKGCYPMSYYKNTGTLTNPTFEGKWAHFESVDVFTHNKLSFVDLDHDGDFDLFAGEKEGIIHYYGGVKK